MTLHDIDDMNGAVREIARVLSPGGRVCVAVVHPINSAGRFAQRTADAPFVIGDSYFEARPYADRVERDGLAMTFSSVHRPIEALFAAFESAGLVVERLVEIPDATAPPGDRWQRIPLFLHSAGEEVRLSHEPRASAAIILVIGLVLVVIGGSRGARRAVAVRAAARRHRDRGRDGGIYIPLGSMIVISVILTLIVNFFVRR